MLYINVVGIIMAILLLGIKIMLVINKDVSKVKAIVEKQIDYLRGSSSDNFFRKNHYSFHINDEYFSVSLLLEEQASGTCWDDYRYEAETFAERPVLVKKAIKVLLSAMLPRKNGKEVSVLVDKVFNEMNTYSYTNDGYYGNYEVFKVYKINLADVYAIVSENILEAA